MRFIFGNLTTNEIKETLQENDALAKPPKSVWLIRESSTFPGILTVSFYKDEEGKKLSHTRYALFEEGWKKLPGYTFKREMTTEEEKDIIQKMDAELHVITEQAIKLFESTVSQTQVESLIQTLTKDGFHTKPIIPSSQLVTKNQTLHGYVLDAFETPKTTMYDVDAFSTYSFFNHDERQEAAREESDNQLLIRNLER